MPPGRTFTSERPARSPSSKATAPWGPTRKTPAHPPVSYSPATTTPAQFQRVKPGRSLSRPKRARFGSHTHPSLTQRHNAKRMHRSACVEPRTPPCLLGRARCCHASRTQRLNRSESASLTRRKHMTCLPPRRDRQADGEDVNACLGVKALRDLDRPVPFWKVA